MGETTTGAVGIAFWLSVANLGGIVATILVAARSVFIGPRQLRVVALPALFFSTFYFVWFVGRLALNGGENFTGSASYVTTGVAIFVWPMVWVWPMLRMRRDAEVEASHLLEAKARVEEQVKVAAEAIKHVRLDG